MDNDDHYHGVRDSMVAGRKELAFFFGLLIVYFYLRFSGIEPTIVIIVGLIGGTWLAFRPSEWAVEGMESTAGHLGYTAYVAGMLSSLASNMPEAVISGIAAFNGWRTGSQDLLDIAVLSILIAAGFNMLLLGITIIISTKGQDDMDVPEEAIKKDSVLIRWTFVALLSMFALGILDMVSPDAPIDPRFPPVASFVLFLSYIIYAAALTTGDVVNESSMAKASHSKRTATVLAVMGFVGIFFAGEILTHSVEMLLSNYHDVIGLIGNQVAIAAFILGAAGALPEHSIALIAAAKGKVGLAVGNLIGGVLQIVLLVMGGIGMFVPIPLDRYVLFQIMVIAGSLWFLKRAITDDHKLDFFEGAMIILLQAYVFVLLIAGTPV
ncbi:MAG: sodium:calcium antiporter [Candidatus Sifarchaeia archaeon]